MSRPFHSAVSEQAIKSLRSANEDLREHVAQLRAALEAERNALKQLRREKMAEIKQIKEKEVQRHTITMSDLKTKLHHDKAHELESQKEALMKKYESDIGVLSKQKDAEISKLRNDIRKLKAELENTDPGRKRPSEQNKEAIGTDKTRLEELKELRQMKRNLEELQTAAKEAEKQKAQEINRIREEFKMEIAKVSKDAQQEIRRLIEELKSKERVIGQLERDLGSQGGHFAKLQMEKECIEERLQMSREAESWERRSSKAQLNDTSSPSSKDEERRLQTKISELTAQVKKYEEQCAGLTQDKTDLLRKVKEVEKKHRPLQDKNKKFLEKNMELTATNRSLEEKLKQHTEDNNKLKQQMESSRKQTQKLNRQLGMEKVDRESFDLTLDELTDLKTKAEEQEKTIAALQQSCKEKDRRLELLQHRQRRRQNNRQQQKAAGIRETYYGYENDDARSVDSEASVSSMSCDTLQEEEVFWDEFAREEFEQNYQRLAKEHLELEKSYSLLQQQAGSHVDPQRETKDLRHLVKHVFDTAWLEEKEKLNGTVRMLRENISDLEDTCDKQRHELREIEEQNEVLEFRCLELEEYNEKLTDDLRTSSPLKSPPILTDSGILQTFLEETGVLEIKVSDLRDKLHDLKYNQDGNLNEEEKLVLLQTKALLDVTEKKLNCFQTKEITLKQRIQQLEEEKEEVIIPSPESEDLVFEYEETRNQLLTAQAKIDDLECSLSSFKQQEEVHRYKEGVNQKTEDRYKREISDLRRKFSSSFEGKEYETEFVNEQAEKLKLAEQKMADLGRANEELVESVSRLTVENRDIRENLESQQDTQALAESDKDMSSQIHCLRSQIHAHEKAENELMEKNKQLKTELSGIKDKVIDYETIEAELTDKMLELQENLETTKGQLASLKDKNECIQGELETAKTQLVKTNSNSVAKGDQVSMATTATTVINAISPNSSDSRELDESDLMEKLDQLKMAENSFQEKLEDMEISEAILKGNLDALLKKESEYKTQIETFKESERDLKQQLADKVSIEQTLDRKVAALEESENKLHVKINKYELLEKDLAELGTLQEASRKELQEKVTELQENEITLKEKLRVISDNNSHDIQTLRERSQMLEIVNLELQEKLAKVSEKGSSNLDLSQEICDVSFAENKHVQMDKAESNLKNQIEKLQESEKNLKHQLYVLEDEKDTKIENLQEKLGNMVENEIKLSQTLNEMEEIERDLRIKISSYENLYAASGEPKVEKFHNQIRELELAEHSLLDRLDELEQNEHVLQEKLQVAEKTYQERIQELEESESCLQERLQDVEAKYHSSSHELEEKNSRLKMYSEWEVKYQDEIHSLEERVGHLEKDRDEKRRELETKTKQLLSHHATERQYQEQIHALSSKAEALETAKTSMTEKYYETDFSKQELQETLEEYERQSQSLNQADQETITTLREAEHNLQNKVMDLEHERSDLSNKLDDEVIQSATMSGRIQSLEESEARLAERVMELEEMENALREQIENLKEKLEGLSGDNDRFRKQLTELEQVDEELRQELQDVVEEKSRLLEKLEELKKSEGQKVEDLQEKVDVLIRSEEKLVQKVTNHEEEEERLLKQLAEYEKSEEQLRGRISELELSEKDLKSRIMALESELSRQKKMAAEYLERSEELEDAHQKKDVMLSANKKKLARIEVLEGEIQEQIETFVQLQNTIHALTVDKENAVQESRQSKGKVNDLENQILVLEQEKKTLIEQNQVKIQEVTAEAQELRENLTQVQGQVEKVTHDLTESETKLTKSIQNEKTTTEQLQKIEADLAKSVQSEKAVVEQVNQTKSCVKDLEEKVTALTNDLDNKNARVAETEELERKFSVLEGEKEEYRVWVADLEEQIQKLEEDLKNKSKELSECSQTEKLNKSDEIISRLESENSQLNDQVHKFEDQNIEHQERIAELEMNAEELQQQLEDFKYDETQRKMQELQQNETILKEKVLKLETEMTDVQPKAMSSLSKENSKLQRRVSDLEKSESSCMEHIEKLEKQLDDLKQFTYSPNKSNEIDHIKLNIDGSTHPFRKTSPLKSLENELEGLSREDLLTRVQELSKLNDLNKKKIDQLETHLSSFREAVEYIAMGTDVTIETIETTRPVKKDLYAEKLQDLVKSEVALRQKVKKLQFDLDQSQQELKDVKSDHTDASEQLEERIDQLERSEAKLKNEVRYGTSTQGREGDALAKIQHLEKLVFDLEANEKKLLRKNEELEERERSLKQRAINYEKDSVAAASSRTVKFKDIDDIALVEDLKAKIRNLESREISLKDEVDKLQKGVQDPESLKSKIENCERTERALKRKIQLLEEQSASTITPLDDMLDTPEDLLRQRIQELERMEKHLRQQVGDLETDQEQLNEIARNDKNHIYEMNVRIRELQLSEKSLKEQLGRLELSEDSLYNKGGLLQDRMQDLEDRVKELENIERQLRDQLSQSQFNHETAAQKLRIFESNISELETSEKQWKRKAESLEKEKMAQNQRILHLQSSVGDLEGSEELLKNKISRLEENKRVLEDETVRDLQDKIHRMEVDDKMMKQKVNELEERKGRLSDTVEELGHQEDAARRRVNQLEALNENMARKIHDLEEERSNLKYEISDLQVRDAEMKQEMTVSDGLKKSLKSQVEDMENQLSSKVHDSQARESEWMSRMSEYERTESSMKEKIRQLEENEQKLKKKIQELEASVYSAKHREACGHEMELTDLKEQLNNYNQMLQEHKMLQDSYEDVKRQLRQLHKQVQEGNIPAHRGHCSVKATQTRPFNSVHNSSDIKNAIELLRSKNPKGFVQLLKSLPQIQPAPLGTESTFIVNSLGHQVAINADGTISEDRILPNQRKVDMGSRVIDWNKLEKMAEPEKDKLRERLVDLLPIDDLDLGPGDTTPFASDIEDSDNSSLDDAPVAGVAVGNKSPLFTLLEQKKKRKKRAVVEEDLAATHVGRFKRPVAHERPIDEATTRHRRRLVAALADKLNMADVTPDLEDDLDLDEESAWRMVEDNRPPRFGDFTEDHSWNLLEDKNGKVAGDDIAIGLTIRDNSSVASGATSVIPDDATSVGSAPPLPNTLPPPMPTKNNDSLLDDSSFYLPSVAGDDNHADDGTDIEDEILDNDEFGAIPTIRAPRKKHDSDFSESDIPIFGAHLKPRRLHGSNDSVADSGTASMFYDPDNHGVGSPSMTSSMSEHSGGLRPLQRLKAASVPPEGTMGRAWKRNVSMERWDPQDELRILQDHVSDLTKQNKVKDKEIAVYKLNQRELEKKVKDSDENFTVKAKLKERERELEVEQKHVRDGQEKMSRLQREVAEKEQQVKQLQAELDSMDRVIKAQGSKTDGDLVRRLRDELENSRIQLERKEQEISAMDIHGAENRSEIEKKDRELREKNQQLDRANQELRKWQRDVQDADTEKLSTLGSFSALQSEANRLRDIDHRYAELKAEFDALKKEHSLCKVKAEEVGRLRNEKEDLETRLNSSHNTGRDLERLEAEREHLEGKLKKTEDNLKAKFDEMERIKNRCQTSVAPLRARVIRMAKLCQERDELIRRLANDIKRHPEASRDLLQEVDRLQAQSATEDYHRPLSPLGEMLADLEDSVDSVNGRTPNGTRRSENGEAASSESSLSDTRDSDDLDYLLNSDLHNGHSSSNRNNGKSSSSPRKNKNQSRHNNTHSNIHLGDFSTNSLLDDSLGSLSDDVSFVAQVPVTQLNNQRTREGRQRTANKLKLPSYHRVGEKPDAGRFMAIANYNPQHFSQSGHSRLELPLKEKDIVQVLGPLDDKGYYEAEVNGRIGLVPASYLHPVQPTPNTLTPQQRQQRALHSGYLDTSPEQILGLHQHLQHAHTPSHNGFHSINTSIPVSPNIPAVTPTTPKQHTQTTSLATPLIRPHAATSQTDGGRPSRMNPALLRPLTVSVGTNSPASGPHSKTQVEGPPDPPHRFQIKRILTDRSILLGWETPYLDELARSNGSTVIGYRIFVNGKEKQKVKSAHLTKALVEKLDLSRPQHFSIQTVADNSQVSKMADTLFEDVLPEPLGESGSDRESDRDGDVSSAISSNQYEDGERRVFIAVYDYSPADHSPHNFPAYELAFKTGDIITTYGPARQDGFYHGELHGRRGLAPASFMEEVSVSRSKHRKVFLPLRQTFRRLLHPRLEQSVSSSSLNSQPPPLSRSSSRGNSSHGNSNHGNSTQYHPAPSSGHQAVQRRVVRTTLYQV